MPSNPSLNSDDEIRHLLDLMPASGRMLTQIVDNSQQSVVIQAPFPYPWTNTRRIFINFDLWQDLARAQRDLVLLRTVSWLCEVRWFAPNLNQGVALAGAVGTVLETMQQDAVGVVLAGGLCALGLRQIWRDNHRSQLELEADEVAIKVAQRRGYSETEAAQALLQGIEQVAKIENRSGLNYLELTRSQNLRALAQLSPVGVPSTIREEN
ncbi:MAG: DUF3318 domain-containing protein [Microcoleaceae cyanobacterium]